MSQPTEVDERVRTIPLHGHDAEVAAEVSGVTPADGQPVAERAGARDWGGGGEGKHYNEERDMSGSSLS